MTFPAVGEQTVFSTGVESSGSYGTPVTPSRSYEILAGESLKRKNRVLQSQAIRGGTRNLRRGNRRVLTGRDAAGDVSFEVGSKGYGRLINQLLGGTPTVVQQASTAAYLQTHTLGSLAGKSQTLQKVLRDPSGSAIKTLTYPGSKIVAGVFSISVDQILTLRATFDCRDQRGDISAAESAYVSGGNLFHFAQATLSVGGSAVANVLNAEVTVTNPSKTDRFYLGNAGLKDEPIDSDFPAVTGQMQAELIDSALYDLFVADGGGALVLEFVGANIASTYNERLTITVPDIHLTDASPTVGSAGVIEEPVTWEAATDSAGDPGIKIELMSTDTAI